MNLEIHFMLNSDMYKYIGYVRIYRILLSGRVSKIQSNLHVQNSTLRAHETGRNFPLKCRGVWLSPVFGVRYISLQCPSIICQHTWGPLASSIAIMSWWNLSPCSSLTSPRFSGEKIQVWLQRVDLLTHIASHSFERRQQVLHNILIVRCFVIS